MKLYLPYGALKSFSGQKQFTIHWFRKERAEPIAAYAQLILHYRQLSAEARAEAEAIVDELFTEEEFQALRTYLYRTQGEDLRTGILVPPISAGKQDMESRLGLVRPFAARIEGERGGFCRLSELEGYNLPFPVWGYYTEPIGMPHPVTAHATL